MKKLLSIVLAAAVLLSMAVGFTVSASAATSASGTCGDNLKWTLKSGTLTISGAGAMYDYVFEGNNAAPWAQYRQEIKSVVVGEGVTYIGVYSFFNLFNMTSAQLPSTLEEIGNGAFQRCYFLKDVNFPASIKTIKARAFCDCRAIQSIVFPEDSQLDRIGELAFNSCYSAETVYLPNSVTFIGHNAFSYCGGLKSIHIPEGLTSIPRFFLTSCTKLASVEIPAKVTKIGEKAFMCCIALYHVDIPAAVKTIDDYAFASCTGLTSINMSDSVKIKDHTFGGCSNLDPIKYTVNLSNSVYVTNVGDTAILSVTAKGTGLKYDWYYRNKGVTEWTKSTCHASRYEVPVTGARYGRQVYCIVTDRYKKTLKSYVTNLMFRNPSIEITQQPVSVQVEKAGDTATVSLTAEGEGLKYTWYYHNKGAASWTESSIHKATVQVDVTEARYGRMMYCVVKDKYGRSVSSHYINLTFDTGLKITRQPVDTAAAVGESAKLKVVAEGKGKTYTWYYKNPGSYYWTKSTCTSSTYTTAMTEARDGRQVYCVVTDKYGAQVQTVVITLSVIK